MRQHMTSLAEALCGCDSGLAASSLRSGSLFGMRTLVKSMYYACLSFISYTAARAAANLNAPSLLFILMRLLLSKLALHENTFTTRLLFLLACFGL